IWAVTDYFKMQGISVLLTHEMHDSAQVSELTKYGISFVADNLILLRYLEEDLEVKSFIRVVKMRSSKHAKTIHELRIEDDKVEVIGVPK
ncbi:MAG TPA: ATPase domain-containing protein, partial [Bacillota bacterium]|nr:ATPase domain-containing protein [Bacillota bacterium]